MPLKVGELAKRCGLTVRTLHHYDQIGLLRSSARSGSGYRLYGRTDIARLHQIQVLRKLGLSLGEIGTWLDEAPASLSRSSSSRSASSTGRSPTANSCANAWPPSVASCRAARNRSSPNGSALWS